MNENGRIPASDYTAHRCPDWDGLMIDCNDDEYQCCTCPQYNGKRGWAGLTKEEVDSWELPENPTVFEFAQFVEAKLKEKNT